MIECVIIGDSIAVGIGQNMPCKVEAKVGRTSERQLALVKQIDVEKAIISLGSNDPRNPELFRNLWLLRASVHAKRVVWILPYDRTAAEAARHVARIYRDGFVDLVDHPTRDRIHPSDYRAVAKKAGE
ncbi:orF1-encoded proteiN [Caudoviricetes sp.]|nr:orF1-encoded proteiN [Caudoviricetes sp.]